MMKKNVEGTVCAVYCGAMCSLFLLLISPKGYTNISEVKAIGFYVLTGLLAAVLLLCGTKPPKRLTLPQLGVCLYGGFTLLSALCSPDKVTALLGGTRWDGAVTVLGYCLLFLALSRFGGCGRWLSWLTAGAVTVYCLVCFAQLMGYNPLSLYPEPLRWAGREQMYNGAFLGFTGNADLSAAVLALFFGVFWAAALRKKKYLFLLPASLCLTVLLLSGMRGGTLGALASLLLLPFVISSNAAKRKLFLFLEGGLLLCALFLIWLLPLEGTLGELHGVLRGQAEDSFGSGRIYIWKEVLKLVPERLWLGGGADTLGLRMQATFTRVREDGTVLSRSIDCAHNEYLNILVNQGLPALLCLLSALAFSLYRALRQNRDTGVIPAAGMIAYLVQALFGISMPGSTAFFWLCWGLLESETIYEGNAKWILQL